MFYKLNTSSPQVWPRQWKKNNTVFLFWPHCYCRNDEKCTK